MKNWGIGHARKQNSFFKTKHAHRFSHGGTLRQKRAGRSARPLSTKQSLHLVLKVNTQKLSKRSLRNPMCFKLTLAMIKKYAKMFSVKIEQVSVQNNHIHALVRTTKRSQYQHFFRVVAGQIAQCFEKEGLLESGVKTNVTDTPKSDQPVQLKPLKLWMYRPHTPELFLDGGRIKLSGIIFSLMRKQRVVKFGIRKTDCGGCRALIGKYCGRSCGAW